MKIGPDQWLTPDILDGMLAIPDLIFVNCCHLGTAKGAKEGTPSPQLAASFAVKLMNLGAKAVIAAGWAVDDRAARTFAERFYERMLAGERFGDAVLAARQRTKDVHPRSNTWGAYQCYGNPDFRLDGVGSQSPDGLNQRRFVAREEILQQVEDIIAQGGDGPTKELLKQLADLRNETPAEWRDGEVLAAFGRAFGELGQFEDAIAAYRQALSDENGKAPLRAAQQIANLLDRSARNATTEQQAALRKEALEWLEKIEPLADTAELAALRGGYHKRNGELEKALEAYERAFEIHKRTFSDKLYYPGLNAAAVAYLLRPNDKEIWQQRITECSDAAARERENVRDVWSRAGVVDAMLLRNLWNETLTAEKKDQITASYIAVIAGGVSHRDTDSILGQIAFLQDKLPNGHRAKVPLGDILTQVRLQSPH